MDARPSAPGPDSRVDAFGPLLSAVLFGYFGFLSADVRQTADDAGNTVLLWVGTLWIVRISTVLFAASAALALGGDRRTDLVYGASSLLATAGLAAILVWDQLDTEYQTVFHPLILLICIAWNGYGSIQTLRDALRRA